MSESFRYSNIFLYSSLQFSGNIEEYFSRHTKKLVVFIVLPRGTKYNLCRVYERGNLLLEKKVIAPYNIFLYYFFWYKNYLQFLLSYFTYNDQVIIISFHPISFIGMTMQKILRRVIFVYWVGDFFPGNNPVNIFYRNISNYYHKRIMYRCYLSDRLNEKMNGKSVQSTNVKTIMWGIKPTKKERKYSKRNMVLGFIGVMRSSQGIPFLLDVIAQTKNVYLKLLGPATDDLYKEYLNTIKKLHIQKKIFFPNKTYYGKNLDKEISTCHVGVALYDEGTDVGTYYADPAKVKTYAQLGLPILMTDSADVAKYVKKFKAGEVIERNIEDAKKAIEKMKRNYTMYQKGLVKFGNFFDFEKYYKEKFLFLEKI